MLEVNLIKAQSCLFWGVFTFNKHVEGQHLG